MRVEEIHRLPELCQDQSYYECVASEFAQNVSCKGLKCLPYTLPSSKILQGLEYCNYTTGEQNCNDKVLNSIMKKKDVCRGGTTNACVVKEYKLKDYVPPRSKTVICSILRFGNSHPLLTHLLRLPRPFSLNTTYWMATY